MYSATGFYPNRINLAISGKKRWDKVWREIILLLDLGHLFQDKNVFTSFRNKGS